MALVADCCSRQFALIFVDKLIFHIIVLAKTGYLGKLNTFQQSVNLG